MLIAALRTLQLVNARSGATGQKLADAMDEAAEPLVEILTRKLEAKTGPITMTRGLARFDAIREGWQIRQNV